MRRTREIPESQHHEPAESRVSRAPRPGATIGHGVDAFRRFAHRTSLLVGTPAAFLTACVVIGAWIVTGPLFNYSDTWQLVINTGTTIVTFLMVFLIQATQNRDASAIHLKLDELIVALKGARNGMVAVEHLSESELRRFQEEFEELSTRARVDRERGTND